MKKTDKKGFTIVELVIVIAVIAILIAVLIPTFSKIIGKANESNDTQIVRQLNTAIEIESVTADEGKPVTMYDANEMTKLYGLDVERLATKSNLSIAWDCKNHRFVLLNEGENKYIFPVDAANSQQDTIATPTDYFVVRKAMPATAKYSIYAAEGWTDPVENLTVGFDAGNVKNITSITYSSNASQDVVIRTNGGKLTVNAPNDHMEHFGTLDFLQIDAIKTTASYVENGYTAQGQIKEGRVVNTKGTIEVDGETKATGVDNLFIETNAAGNGFGTVVVASQDGADLPTLDRGEVTIGDGVLVVEVQELTGETKTSDEFIWLFGNGTVEAEKVVVTASATKPTTETCVLNNATKSGKAGEEIANIARKNADGTKYLKADGSETDNPAEAGTEKKATKEDLEKSQGENALFAFGAGTKNNPYGISNSKEFNAIDTLEEDMYNNGKAYYFIQIQDITFVDSDSQYVNLIEKYLTQNQRPGLVSYFNGTYNGNNHTISVNMAGYEHNQIKLFQHIGGDSVIENLNLYLQNDTLVRICDFDHYGLSTGSTTYKNITVNADDILVLQGITNGSFFTQNGPDGSDVYFVDCVNNVSVETTGGSFAAFCGFIENDFNTHYSFIRCTNNGNITAASSAGVLCAHSYYGSWDQSEIDEYIYVEDVKNNGIISASKQVGLFSCETEKPEIHTYINEKYKDMTNQSAYVLKKPLSGEFTIGYNNGFEIKTTNSDAKSFKIKININSIWFVEADNQSNTTNAFLETKLVDNITSSLSINNIHVYDSKKALENGIIVSENMDYKVKFSMVDACFIEKDGNLFIVIDNRNNAINSDCGVSLSIIGYDTNGFSVGSTEIK